MDIQNSIRNNIQFDDKYRIWNLVKYRKRNNLKLEEYLHQFLIRKKTSLHPNTLKDYSQVVRDHINPFIGAIKLKNLKPDHIQTFYSIKLDSGTTPTRIHFIHAVLNSALNLAVRRGYIKRNPASSVTKPKIFRREMKTLSVNQVRILLNAVKGSRLEALLYLAVTAGLRKAEILGLQWPDLEWDTGNLRVQRQLQRVHGEGLIFTEPKSASGRRLIVLGPKSLKILQQHKDRQYSKKRSDGEKWYALDLIFTRPHGLPFRPRDLNRNFKSILEHAGLPGIRFHDLRHTAATMMLICGIHPKVVQERLGHSRIGITLDIYSHVLPGMQIEAAQKIDELITGSTETS